MTYQEFKTNLIQALSVKLGTSYRVVLQDIIKNNDTHLDGLTILSENTNISPTIYLNYYYNQYLSGKNISSIEEDILSSYRQNAQTQNIDITFFTDFKKAKERIIFKLVNYERNRELLADVPHIRYLDLAIIFNCFINTSQNNYATILIHNHHLSYWQISPQELYSFAIRNTPFLLPPHIQNMSDIFTDIFFEQSDKPIKENILTIPMYILSNVSKLHGAGCILYENLLAETAERIGNDFYLIPSSIHEMLIIPADCTSHEELAFIVQEVNATQLSRDEILSDHAYFYSCQTGQITMTCETN